LFDESVGAIAAIFLALTFLHVRDSHYATTDVPMTFFVMCAMLAIVRLHQDRRATHAWAAALFAGLATGTKYNAALLAIPMTVVELLYVWPRRNAWRTLARSTYLPLMAVVMIGTFLATSPYLLIDHDKALQDFRALQASMSVGMTPPELLGSGWIYHFRFSLVHGMGWPLLVASIAGIPLMARRNPVARCCSFRFPVAYYIVAGASANVFVRYMIPVLPFLCLFAATFVDAAPRCGSARVERPQNRSSPARLPPRYWRRRRGASCNSIGSSARETAASWPPTGCRKTSRADLELSPPAIMYGIPPLEDRINPKVPAARVTTIAGTTSSRRRKPFEDRTGLDHRAALGAALQPHSAAVCSTCCRASTVWSTSYARWTSRRPATSMTSRTRSICRTAGSGTCGGRARTWRSTSGNRSSRDAAAIAALLARGADHELGVGPICLMRGDVHLARAQARRALVVADHVAMRLAVGAK
jgi:hypothetical protein